MLIVSLFPFGSFLFEVQLHSKVNKMNVENLATVMGINLLKPQIEDPVTVMKGENASLTCPSTNAWAHLCSLMTFKLCVSYSGSKEGSDMTNHN